MGNSAQDLRDLEARLAKQSETEVDRVRKEAHDEIEKVRREAEDESERVRKDEKHERERVVKEARSEPTRPTERVSKWRSSGRGHRHLPACGWPA